jgi:hypothetical protein
MENTPGDTLLKITSLSRIFHIRRGLATTSFVAVDKFAGRCPHVMDVCKTVVPADVQADGRMVKCHLYDPQYAASPRAVADAIPLQPAG